MNRLWIRLSLGVAGVLLLGFLGLGLYLNQQVSAQARSFIGQQEVQDSGVITALADYYGAHHSWDGVASVIQIYYPAEGNGMNPGQTGAGNMGSGMMGGAGMDLVVADASGQIVYDTSQSQASGSLTSQDWSYALPIDWQGQRVGWLVVRTPVVVLSTSGQAFLAQVNQSLLQAAVGAGLLGLLLGIVLARGLTIPLGRLAGAVQAIAAGDFKRRVEEKGPQEIRSLARTFNAMAAHLEEAERLRRNLVADIAHELRTPLSVLQGNLRAILDEVYPLDQAEVAVLYDETLRLNRLVTDLHELALSEAGQLHLQLVAAPVEPLVRHEASLFGEMAAAQGVALRLDLAAEAPLVRMDPDRTRQVLHNLLTNALRHTPAPGQITVTLDCPDEQEVRFQVQDSGRGIAPDELPHVFERFWRAERSRSSASGGSGLGLSIAKALVEQQGGRMGVTSEPGKGSTFWFTLPPARDPTPAEALTSC